MEIDLELYRREVRLGTDPLIRLSAIDVAPEYPRRTLVFLHGYGGWATQWRYQLNHFSQTDRVIALDQRGHGRSDSSPAPYDMRTLLSDLHRALERLSATGPIVLAGHSFGGAVAAEFSLAYPNRVSHLVLIATAGEFRLHPIYRALLSLPLFTLRLATPFTQRWLGAAPHVLRQMYRHVLHDWRGWELFGKLTVPTLVIRGHRDLVFQAQMFERVAEAIPGAEEVNVGASGHMVMLERRQAVNRAIENFLDEAPASWRDAGPKPEETHRSALVQDRPWLVHYDDGVPYTISIPPIALHRLLRSAVRRFPLRTAVIFEGRHLTYRRLNREVNRFANALIGLGMRPGDRVMLLLPNSPQLVISFYGVLKAAGVAVFTLPTTRREELIRQIRDSGARTLVTLQRNAEIAHAARAETDLEHIILTGLQDYRPAGPRSRKYAGSAGSGSTPGMQAEASGSHEFLPLLYRHKAQSPDVHVAPDDLALIIFTGGTTDAPKGVMLSHRNLVANALQTRHWMPDAEEGRERILCVLPFTHSYGLTVGLNVGIALGATLILKPQFEVEDVLQSIRSHQPTMFPGVPNMYVAIKDFPGVRRYKVDSIRACLSGAAPLPVEVQEAFEKLTRGRLVEGYGLSEASPVTHANPIAGRRRIGSIGLPLPSTEARVVDLSNGKETVAFGQIGELAVRGPQVMAGYWENPEATRRVLSEDGWLLTGDVVQMNPDGFFRLIARKADMWYPEKPEEPAFPRDVEEVIYEIPQVKEAAVVAVANQPVAFVIAQPDRPSPDAVLAYCRRRLPPELVPRFVVFVDDFPRTFIGKILRRELKKRYEQQHS